MEPCLNFYKFGSETMKAMSAREKQIPRSRLDKSLIELVRLRPSVCYRTVVVGMFNLDFTTRWPHLHRVGQSVVS